MGSQESDHVISICHLHRRSPEESATVYSFVGERRAPLIPFRIYARIQAPRLGKQQC